MESSRGSLRFDEFPTNMKRRDSCYGARATRLLAYENARPSESRRQPSPVRTGTQGLRRPRFPFFVSQCQRAGGRAAGCRIPEPLREANPPSRVNDNRSVPEKNSVLAPLLSLWIARSRLIPQDVRTTRARRLFKERLGPCQGRESPHRFLLDRGS
jgi:hypothetical protein